MKPRLHLSAGLCIFFIGLTSCQQTAIGTNSIVRDPDFFDEVKVFRIWNDICENGAVEQGTDGDDYVFCAQVANPTKPIIVNHPAIQLDKAKATKGNQIIVIDPPYYNYQHRFLIQGDRASPHKTTIFVRPPKHNHEIELKDETTAEGKPRKPTVVYLKPEDTQEGDEGHVEASDQKSLRSGSRSDSTPDVEGAAASGTNSIVHSAPKPTKTEGEGSEEEKSVVRTARAPLPLPVPIPVAREVIPQMEVVASGSATSTVFFKLNSGPEMRYTIGY